MGIADIQYNKIVQDIIDWGYDEYGDVRAKWKDGTPAYTKSIIGQQMRFDNTELPILTTKRVAWKTAIKELLWIWQMKSNRVQDLRDMGVKIWNEWEQEDGTIGKAYGYQLAKKNRKLEETFLIRGGLGNEIIKTIKTKPVYLDQVDYLIHQLIYNPSSRRHITMLWNPDELDEMSLTPCVYETQWHVKGNKLHLEVRSRSNDMGLGNPFNVFQYNVLQRMIAQVTGYELGEYIYHIGDAHVYDRHEEALQEQAFSDQYEPPTLLINKDINDFYDFTIDDFELVNYRHGDKVDMEVAI
ncbi:thymidylate synthase [Bacillus sp. Marseille-P3800]|uniref:thymidylate synthase n=1 Tax=Bacillus sp. Marseille-P3800 TaxID=2014782 RepID=UPI000C08771A|nr:thymidylate synthase [Bacillus sp. Marseille-P3800]